MPGDWCYLTRSFFLLGMKYASFSSWGQRREDLNPMPEKEFNILVVDDDVSFCTIMKEFLRMDGYKVHLAYDVPHAFSLLERFTPDLILTDIMMPDVDGLCLVRNIRTEPAWADIPTIVISARTLPEERTAARDAGADAFVSKPFSLKDLRAAISTFLPCAAS